MNALRTLLTTLSLGALVGTWVSGSIAPKVLTWSATPGFAKAMCDCEATAHGVAEQLIHSELIGAGVGAGVGLAVYVAWMVLMRRKKTPASSAPAV